MVATQNWEVHQIDVYNAFLGGNLNEKVYMKLPPSFCTSSSDQVCRLHKSLYGLRQAPPCWFEKLPFALKQSSFQQSNVDYSLFIYHKHSVYLSILVYVDDLIITGNYSTTITNIKKHLGTSFHMKDLGF